MRFTISLTPISEQHLAAAWLASLDRPAVAAAAHEMELLLAADPLRVGESRASSVSRTWFIPPIGFTFDVVVDDAADFVTAIWLTS